MIELAKHAGCTAEAFEAMSPYWQARYYEHWLGHAQAGAKLSDDARWAADFNRRMGHF